MLSSSWLLIVILSCLCIYRASSGKHLLGIRTLWEETRHATRASD
jgi:hypothetical protein